MALGRWDAASGTLDTAAKRLDQDSDDEGAFFELGVLRARLTSHRGDHLRAAREIIGILESAASRQGVRDSLDAPIAPRLATLATAWLDELPGSLADDEVLLTARTIVSAARRSGNTGAERRGAQALTRLGAGASGSRAQAEISPKLARVASQGVLYAETTS